MIVTCPDCGSEYSVDDHVFGAAGRPVKCSRCACEWFQMGPSQVGAPALSRDPAPDEQTAPDVEAEARAPVSGAAAGSAQAAIRAAAALASASNAPRALPSPAAFANPQNETGSPERSAQAPSIVDDVDVLERPAPASVRPAGADPARDRPDARVRPRRRGGDRRTRAAPAPREAAPSRMRAAVHPDQSRGFWDDRDFGAAEADEPPMFGPGRRRRENVPRATASANSARESVAGPRREDRPETSFEAWRDAVQERVLSRPMTALERASGVARRAARETARGAGAAWRQIERASLSAKLFAAASVLFCAAVLAYHAGPALAQRAPAVAGALEAWRGGVDAILSPGRTESSHRVVFVEGAYDIVETTSGRSLVVWGVVANNGSETALTPTIEIISRAENGEALQRWTTEVERQSLAPGETARFVSRMMNPEGPVYDVDLEIAPR